MHDQDHRHGVADEPAKPHLSPCFIPMCGTIPDTPETTSDASHSLDYIIAQPDRDECRVGPNRKVHLTSTFMPHICSLHE